MEEVSRLNNQTLDLHTLPLSSLSAKLKSLLSISSNQASIDQFSSISALKEKLISGFNGIYTKYFTDYLSYIHSYQPTKKNLFPSLTPALDPSQLSKLHQCVLQLTQEGSSNEVYLLIYDSIDNFINKLWEQISKIPESEYKRQECLLAAYRLIEISASEVNQLTKNILLYEMKIGIGNICKLLFQEKVVDELDKIIDRGNTSLYLIRKEIRFYKREIRQMFNSIYSNTSRHKHSQQTSRKEKCSEYTAQSMSIDELVAYIECKDKTDKHSRNRRKNSHKSTDSSSNSESPHRENEKDALLEQEIRDFQIKLDSRPVQIHRFKLKLNPEWIESLRREIWAKS